MPICSCGFTIRGFLSAIQFLYVIVDKLCDIFIIWTTKCYGFVDLHLFLKLVGFFACIGVGERKVILFIMLYYWHQNVVFLTYMLSNWSSSIPFVFLHECRMSSDTSQGSNDVNSFNAWKWKYSKSFSFVMHT